MKSIILKIKTDLYNVFVKGDSDTTQQARVFALIAIPVMSVLLTFGNLPIY